MLIWKTQTLNVNIASIRYRCLLPLKYLAAKGIAHKISGGADPVPLTAKADAIVFVKSFRDQDVATCEQAARLGVPIILDLCDNIFIQEYATGNRYDPAKNFQLMAEWASAIVTTGEPLKVEVEQAIASLNPIIAVIPDSSETLADIDYAFRITRLQRLQSLVLRPALKRSIKAIKQSRDRLNWRKKQKPATQSTKPTQKQSGVQPTPVFPARWPQAEPNVKTILWFGNHGAKYGSFGMSSILTVADAIEKLSQELPLRLVVVSNHLEKYERDIAPLPFETVYLRWHPRKIYDYIQASDVTIIPNSQSRYSICKSANRAVLALSQGTPVVASRTPALNLFEGCIALDDWEAGLRRYLLDDTAGAADVALAQRAIAQNLSGETIAQKWASPARSNRYPNKPRLPAFRAGEPAMIKQPTEQIKARLQALLPSRFSQKPKILLFINLPQDLDMLLPLAERLSKQPGLRPRSRHQRQSLEPVASH